MTATVIDPAGPALTTTVRLPGLLGGTLVDGVTLVVGTDVEGTLVVGTLVVGATLVVGMLVDGEVVVDGDVLVVGLVEVVGVSEVLGDTDVTVGSTLVVEACAPTNGVLAETAAVTPIQSPRAVSAIAVLRRVICGDLLVVGLHHARRPNNATSADN